MTAASLFYALLLASVTPGAPLDNGVGALPFMGFTTWDAFACRPSMNESSVRAVMDLIVQTGLRDLGYTRIDLDDCWQQRAPNGSVVADPVRFPSGIAALATYAHNASLLLGLYTDVGNTTCAGHPGSYGYESGDAEAYAAWGADFLKEDHCNLPNPLPDGMDEDEFYNFALTKMRDALNATGRRIFFDLCAHSCYGGSGADLHSAACWSEWYHNATLLGNSRRTTTDAAHTWPSVIMNWYRNDACECEGAHSKPGIASRCAAMFMRLSSAHWQLATGASRSPNSMGPTPGTTPTPSRLATSQPASPRPSSACTSGKAGGACG